MAKKVIHKNKFRNGWFTKLCDPTLYYHVNVAHYWRDVTCKRCLKMHTRSENTK